MIEIIKFLYQHPLNKKAKLTAIIKFIKWQLINSLWNGAFVYTWINESKLIVSKGMTGATGNIYVGLMEYRDMSFLLHYLKNEDLFYDIGANVGVYTVLASKVKKAKTVSIEPLPSTYEKLQDNIHINRLDNVISLNLGLSYEKSKLYFTTDKDTMNSVAISSDKNVQEVNVDTLDNLVQLYGAPKVIKIDVEGYETNVLKGAHKLLSGDTLEVIILELNGSGTKYGFNDDQIHTDLKKNGFDPFSYDPFQRSLLKIEHYGTSNTIYIKTNAVEKIKTIIQHADSFSINGFTL